MKSDDVILTEIGAIDDVEHVINLFRDSEIDMMTYLADTVASLCNIDKDEMLSKTARPHIANARWLYWYAYRYMTRETYEKIAEMTNRIAKGHFTASTICSACNRMEELKSSEPMWQKRWNTIKRIVRMRDCSGSGNDEYTITVCVPRELKEMIKIEVKEK